MSRNPESAQTFSCCDIFSAITHCFCCHKLTPNEKEFFIEAGRNATGCATLTAYVAFLAAASGSTISVAGVTSAHLTSPTMIPCLLLGGTLAFGTGANLGFNAATSALSIRESIRLRFCLDSGQQSDPHNVDNSNQLPRTS